MISTPLIEHGTDVDSVLVWFRLLKSHRGYPRFQDWEELSARPARAGYRIEAIPFFDNRVSRGDIVAATVEVGGFLQFDSVLRRGGRSTFRVWLNPHREPAERLIAKLTSLGAHCTMPWDRLITLDVPRESLREARKILRRGRAAGRWGLQEGFIFDPNRKV